MTKEQKPWETLVQFVKNNPKKGYLIPHSQIEIIIGIPYKNENCNCHNKVYSYQIAKANEELTTLSLRLESIKGYGYRIMEDKAYIKCAQGYYDRATRIMTKASTIVSYTGTKNLTMEEAKELIALRGRINKALSIMS